MWAGTGMGSWLWRLADPSHWLHLQLLPIHGLNLVEGGVGANDHKGGSCRKMDSSGPCSLFWSPLPHSPDPVLTQNPEDGRACTSQPEEGKGDGSSHSILMGWAHLSAWGTDSIGAAALSQSNPQCPSTVQWEPQDHPNSSCQGPPSPGTTCVSSVFTVCQKTAHLPQPSPLPPTGSSRLPIPPD